jgi:predicted ATPase/DNA-binding XRE family transcriptional regulator
MEFRVEGNASFGYWLRRRRKAFDLTQEDLAERVGCSLVMIRKIESDARRPSRQIAEILAEQLLIPVEERPVFIQAARAEGLVERIQSPVDQPILAVSEATPEQSATSYSLPLPLTPLIGRARQLEQLRDLLGSSEVRLVTVSGPGGIGKTRFALEIAAQMRSHFRDGVCFVPLAALSDSALVGSTIAQALGVHEEGSQSIEAQLGQFLATRELFLVLDNFEQIMQASTLVSTLLQSAPKLKVMVTSREVLHIRGEHELPLPTLDLPKLHQHLDVDEVAQHSAIELFVARAQAIKSSFQLNRSNVAAVASICARLDGLPLALELVAARIKLLSPQSLAERLTERLPLLTGGARDLPERHQTLRNAIEWSYNLLTPEEQQLFAELSIFVGGCSLEALEAVCQSGSHQLLDLLGSLVNKSLVRQVELPDGDIRFFMLETIREYGWSHASMSEELENLIGRYTSYYLDLAEEAEPQLTGPEQDFWFDRLESEHDNLRSALALQLDRKQGSEAARMAAALWRFWYVRNHLSEGRQWFSRILQAGENEIEAGALARALIGNGVLAWMQSDYTNARSAFEASLPLLQQVNDQQGTANALNNLGGIASEQGDYSHASQLYEESLVLRRQLGDQRGIANALNNLAIVAIEQGDYSQARQLHEESLVLRRQLSDQWGIAHSLNNLAMVAIEQGDYPTAQQLQEEALQLARELGDQRGVATSLSNLGEITLLLGDLERPASFFSESIALFEQLSDQRGIAECLERVSVLAVQGQHWQQALRFYGAAQALRETIGVPLTPTDRARYEPIIAAAESQLDPQLAQTARNEGRSLALEELVAAIKRLSPPAH